VQTHRFKNFEQEYYVQDQFRVTPKLTLTAGIRYAYLGVPYETNGQQVHMNIGPREYLLNRVASMSQGISYNPVLQELPAGKANNAPGYWTPGKLDFAPRFAFNYSPDGKTSIRGGFMLAYDHFGMAVVDVQNDSYSYGLSSINTSVSNLTIANDPRFTSTTAIPTQIIPPPPTGTIPFPFVIASGSAAGGLDDTLRAPYAEIFNLSVQRDLRRGMTLTATYTGRLGRHLMAFQDNSEAENLYDPASNQNWYQVANIMDRAKDAGVSVANFANIPYLQNFFPNAIYKDPVSGIIYHGTQAVYGQLARGNDAVTLYSLDISAANSSAGQTRRFYHPQARDYLSESSIAVSSYNSLQLSLRHTLTKNFIYDFNYTYAHSLDQTSEPERGSSTTSNTYTTGNTAAITNAFNPSASYANSDFDIRHLITADWTLALPYGHGQRFGANSSTFMNEVLGGWNVNGIAKYSSALPWSVLSTGSPTDLQYLSYDVQIAPVQNSGHHTYLENSTGVITPNAFGNGKAAYASFRLPYAGETGQRNTMRADGYFSLDPAISKSFPTFKNQSFKLIVEVFNVTNATRFGLPPAGNSGSGGQASFGNYAAPLLNSPRQMQFSGRYYF
jgi:hypothetical protein